MKIVTGLFEPVEAISAARHLRERGFSVEDQSLVSSVSDLPESLEGDPEDAVTGGATVGAVTGGALGALGTLVASSIPGLESMFVSGLITTSAGSVIGGFLGSLYSVRAESQDEMKLHEELEAGKTLLVVKTTDEDADTVKKILREQQGQNIEVLTLPQE